MSAILVPTGAPEDWKRLLAQPELHWKSGYSARALAYCWEEAAGLPGSVAQVFRRSAVEALKDFELLLAIPEHQVPLPGGRRASQNDLWLLGRGASGLMSVAVEGKVGEPFGPTIEEWSHDPSPGKTERLSFLLRLLGLDQQAPGELRYQLLHRTASAILEAERFCAPHAMMLVHSFSQDAAWFDDYAAYVSLMGGDASVNGVTEVGCRSGKTLQLAWVTGDAKFLEC